MGKEIYNIINDMAENSKAGVVKSISIFIGISKLEYCKDKLYHVISKYYVVDQKEYVMEIICCLDEQLELSRQENSSLILKYLGKLVHKRLAVYPSIYPTAAL